ncbi:DUF1800 family protein [Dongia sp.]|uniref:DUF1800 domain-containing protein n=1 Tax=Dongia sp. TaxID=1977262 RepID=UPI0035B1CEE5
MAEPAVIAANRFGLGARPGELDKVRRDPRGWLSRQIEITPASPPVLLARPGMAEIAASLPGAKAVKDGDAMARKKLRDSLHSLYLADVSAQLSVQVATETGFHERLVQFWLNHFTVSGTRRQIVGFAGAFEREAIRPHVLGGFGALLRAAALHPTMLLYLDNARSVGPNSKLGNKREIGLNENLARELMELHSLGVGGGYGQDDVRALANILTGWTVSRAGLPERLAKGERGSAIFVPALHEPGPKTLLGRTYGEAGGEEAERAIADLANHPATAKFIAAKLARHFTAEAPSTDLTDALARAYLESGGHLPALYRVLIERPDAWRVGSGKLRSPHEWVVALLRGIGQKADLPGERIVAAMKALGQQPFFAPSPAGWPDRDDAWLSPESLMARVDFARVSATRAGDIDPLRFVAETLGGRVAEATMFQLRNAANRPEGLALAMLAPEFLRR